MTLFGDPVAIGRLDRLNLTLDCISARYGRRTVALAGAGIDKARTMRAGNRIPAYATD